MGPVRRMLIVGGLIVAAAVPATAYGHHAARGDDVRPSAGAAAQNVSVIIQVLWQVQQGCAERCTGSSQTQSAGQRATTLQVAAATASGPGTAAVATNMSATIQLIVQNQFGCVAFCFGTTRLQTASQHADASQLASAIADALASTSATNTSHTTQLVWQYQDACVERCVDVQATQVVEKAAQNVAVAARGVGAGAPAAVTADGPPLPPQLESFTTWLATVAAQATITVAEQRDVAPCLHDCTGDVQVQIAMQENSTTQVSVATLALAAQAEDPDADDDAPEADPATAPRPWHQPRVCRSRSLPDFPHRRSIRGALRCGRD